jgi:hypothetical protein
LLDSLLELERPLKSEPLAASIDDAVALVEATLKACREILDKFEQKSWFGKLVKRRAQKHVRNPLVSFCDVARIFRGLFDFGLRSLLRTF